MEFHHPFFREKAVQEYIQRQEKDFLPQFFAPHRIILAYLLLLILLLAGLLVWCSDVPFFVSGSGFVMPAKAAPAARTGAMQIVLFLPARYRAQFHRGELVEWQVAATGPQFSGTIESIESRPLSPEELRQQLLVSDYAAQALAQSSVEVILQPNAQHMPRLRGGEMVRAQVQVGSRHIF